MHESEKANFENIYSRIRSTVEMGKTGARYSSLSDPIAGDQYGSDVI